MSQFRTMDDRVRRTGPCSNSHPRRPAGSAPGPGSLPILTPWAEFQATQRSALLPLFRQFADCSATQLRALIYYFLQSASGKPCRFNGIRGLAPHNPAPE